jgi:hypothetical protein
MRGGYIKEILILSLSKEEDFLCPGDSFENP